MADILKSYSISHEYRLQVAVWDHARARANECHGSMSFSLSEIASTSRIAGWFKLMPYREGRLAHMASDGSGSGSTAGSLPSSPGITMQPTAPLAQQQHQGMMHSESMGLTSIGSSGSARQLLSASPKASRKVGGGGGDGGVHAAAPITLGFSSGHKMSKKDIAKLQEQLQEMQDSNQRHFDEKVVLLEKLEESRRNVEKYLPMQGENRRLEREKDELQAQLDAAMPQHEEEVEALELENARLNEMMRLQMEDSDRAR